MRNIRGHRDINIFDYDKVFPAPDINIYISDITIAILNNDFSILDKNVPIPDRNVALNQ